MIQIEDTIVSFDLIEEQFVCNLTACKGICCVEGDAGAPLETEEVEQLELVLPMIKDKLSKKSLEVIARQGVSYIDEDGEPVTSIVDGKECVFTFWDEGGVCKCAIEQAYKEGKIQHNKPMSCHLYPVRLQKYNEFTAVNYHRWMVCDCAREHGKTLSVPVYKFLKEPLIRKFGSEWYQALELAATQLERK
jgi:Protein of unknown function (DUF3109)